MFVTISEQKRKMIHLKFALLSLLVSIEARNYILEIQKGVLTYYNKDFGTDIYFGYTKPNKNDVIVSAKYTVTKKDIGSAATLAIETYRFVNNAWKSIPIPVEVNICDMFKKNLYVDGLRDLMNHGNLTPCEVQPTHYYLKNFKPELDFPPLIPSGQYMARGIIKVRKVEAFKMEWFAILTRVS